ncbi:MAG: DegV family protein [Trueperaceae bacterium]|nr:DegV family protein [Trueperaceae bacterium]
MKLAIVTDSTCDLRAEQIERLGISTVPLYVNFKGKMHRDWVDITPRDIVEGVKSGADLPTTSQPSPKDFEEAYEAAAGAGAEQILVITISSEFSGTFNSASLAKEASPVPVTAYDSRAASMGIGNLVQIAAEMRDEGAELDAIVAELDRVRATLLVLFSVDTLDFLLKGGRVSKASALLGGLLNIKPILTVTDGKIVPFGKVRGTKKAIAELVTQFKSHAERHDGTMVVDFLHCQDPEAAERLKAAMASAGVRFTSGHTYEIGAVIAAHVGPGTFGAYAHVR